MKPLSPYVAALHRRLHMHVMRGHDLDHELIDQEISDLVLAMWNAHPKRFRPSRRMAVRVCLLRAANAWESRRAGRGRTA